MRFSPSIIYNDVRKDRATFMVNHRCNPDHTRRFIRVKPLLVRTEVKSPAVAAQLRYAERGKALVLALESHRNRRSSERTTAFVFTIQSHTI